MIKSVKNLFNRDLGKLIEEINQIPSEEPNICGNLKQDKLSEIYPTDVFDEKMTTEFFLIHLYSHLSYHLGQINYLRRIMTDMKYTE
jgi:uncharacterized damage-inducible protein DinB